MTAEDRMIYHASIGVRDIARARKFYAETLAPLGGRLLYEFEDEGEVVSLGFGKSFPELWVNLPLDGKVATTANGAHLAFFAEDKISVDAFHAAAVSAGGIDNGAPGYRSEYQAGYYGAFVKDPDGNKLEAVWLDLSKEGTSLA